MKKLLQPVLILLIVSLFSTACTSKKKEDNWLQTWFLFMGIAAPGLLSDFLKGGECPTSTEARASLNHCTAERSSWDNVAQNIQFAAIASKFGRSARNTVRATLPTSKYLYQPTDGSTNYFPPMGNQGQYGTCVAWAVGYNMKSYLEAVDTQASPTATTAQFSPKYLFWSIADDQKGSGCGGTGFEVALSSVQTNGIPTESTVPYENLGNCSNSTATSDSNWSTWSTEAANYKIENYRRLETTDRTAIKESIANNRPVVIGAKLGDNFMNYTSGTLNSPETYNYSGQHAYHAMIIGGYDDSRSAYLVVNSWGSSWGDQGTVWVDYSFFENEFGFAAFVAKNAASSNKVTDSGQDLEAVSIAFASGSSSSEVKLQYSIKNIGQSSVTVSDGSTSQWRAAVVYYSATDANDFGVLYYDRFISSGSSSSCTTATDSTTGATYCDWNIDFAQNTTLTRDSTNSVTLSIPNVTGEYYFAIVADSEDDVSGENDEANNYVWSTSKPVKISGGVVASDTQAALVTASVRSLGNGEKSFHFAEMKKLDPNAYTPEEIGHLIRMNRIANEAFAGQKTTKVRSTPGVSIPAPTVQ
ncbi:MAG: C1 family peptidase [Spirochaetota bacterium]